MTRWKPDREWEGQDAIIIGGGSSLAKFDFERLRGRNTIGCNDAFKLGPEIVKVCVFADSCWFHRNKWDLEKFPNTRVTHSPSLVNLDLPWLKQMVRAKDGLQTNGTLAYNYSTGATAVNLALYYGATRIFLLGFDMGRGQNGRTHWHHYNERPIQDESYKRFMKGFASVHLHLKKFPGVKVLNVTAGSSNLQFFTRIPFETFYKYIPPQNRGQCVECEKRKAIVEQARQEAMA